jgi:hypothetical protein
MKRITMTNETIFPPLTDFEPTRQTLQWYSRAVGVIPRAHAEFHPKWWHISLKVVPDGLVTDKMELPDGGAFWVKMDLVQHKVIVQTKPGPSTGMETFREFSMTDGLTSTQFGDQLLEATAELGLTAEYTREKFENDEPRIYQQAAVGNFLTALTNADRILKQRRTEVGGDASPVQLWPHGFDISYEWFGTRIVEHEENGQIQGYPSQLNLGFYPGDPSGEPYFYSNPWPFEGDILLDNTLPAGASWHTEGWQGTYLPYSELAGDSQAEERLLAFARAVYELASPTLTA